MSKPEISHEIVRIFELQGAHRQLIRSSSANQRMAKLKKLHISITDHFSEALAALASDLGKPAFEAVMDVGAALAEIDETIVHLKDWMLPVAVTLGQRAAPGASAKIIYQPKGRVLIFGPWNFPFSLVFQPLVSAIASGNTAIVKPSEMAPATAALSAKIIGEVFEPAEVAVFEGGTAVATELLEQPFEHVFFTGSTNIGRRVLTAASKHLSSVTLELGGKCPAIIGDGVDISMAASRIGWGKYLNAGQVCLAPDHVWIKTDQRDNFANEIISYIEKSYYSKGTLTTPDLARIIDERNLARLQHLLQDAVARGARVIFGGKARGLQLEPTVLVDVARDCAIMEEEIFGPILPILTYVDIDDVVKILNSRDNPLGLYLFSDRQEFVDNVLLRTSSGGVTVNDVIRHATDPNLPFGGVGASGMGAYHGIYGFHEMSHARSVYNQAMVDPAEVFLRPPYGDRMPG